eukprot:NODE_6699_length_1647_cov_4.010526.p1 GENE.NODE_6699_length_1647_cov_4.010526~~NODE_6699_length_1647_cov_4.010526.p1  ORF type:complete len:512 (-),score=172.11 NODE_6699_length_1647_cov_4.010526:112-1551(-)
MQDWLDGLPAEELTPAEQSLCRALVRMIETAPTPFNILMWIDHRVGGEVEARYPKGMKCELHMRSAAGAAQVPAVPPTPAQALGLEAEANTTAATAGVSSEALKASFFGSLPQDSFSPPEAALRDAIFEFLALWKSRELGTLHHLQQCPTVTQRRGAFLPKKIALREWVERRIGGEVELMSDEHGQDLVHLSPTAREIVVGKHRELARAAIATGGGGGGLGGGPQGAPAGHGHGVGDANQAGGHMAKDAFFAGLPTKELTAAEAELREVLLDWLQRWPHLKPENRAPGSHPHLSDTGGDSEIRRCRTALLPPKIKLGDWIERRIGGEVELRPVKHGQHLVMLRGAADADGGHGGGDTNLADADGGHSAGDGNSADAKERFFESFSPEDFAPAEMLLREELLNFLHTWQGTQPPTFDAANNEKINRQKRKVLPKGCPASLREWIDRRIGADVETFQDARGVWVFRERGAEKRTLKRKVVG